MLVIPPPAARAVNPLYKRCQMKSSHLTSAPKDSGIKRATQVEMKQKGNHGEAQSRGRKGKRLKTNRNRGSSPVVSDKADACSMTHMDSESDEDKNSFLLLYTIMQSSWVLWFEQ